MQTVYGAVGGADGLLPRQIAFHPEQSRGLAA